MAQLAQRTMVMSRKGSPVRSGTAPDTGDDNNTNGGDRGSDAHTDSDGSTVTCPNCGCTFDPETGDVSDDESKTVGKHGDGEGAKLEIPAPSPDAQAPVGTDAITNALARVFAAQGH